MSEMRLMEKFRLCKLTDLSYTWDTIYTNSCYRAGEDYNAAVRTTATTTVTSNYNNYPTYNSNPVNFIVPRRYKYTTVFDGIVRGNVRLELTIGSGAGSGTYTLYVRLKIYLKAITSAGGTRTLASSGYSTVFSGTGQYQSGWGLTVDVPFLLDVDNAVLENDERLLIVIDPENTGIYAPPGADQRSNTVNIYHTINTDESFIELPIVP